MAILDQVARLAVRDALMRRRNVGTVTKPELAAAIAATDDWIDTNAAAFNAALPQPFRTAATLDEKTILFCYVALKRAGLLPDGGV
jgi:hypothetical protein